MSESSRDILNNLPSNEGPGPSSAGDNRDSTDFNAVDAVHLFNTKIDIALEKQRVSIVSELQDKFKTNADFKGEGNKIQYSFNEERLRNLDTLSNNITFGDLKGALTLIESEKKSLNYRNKLLKIADKYGWDTVKEYTDSDIADNAEDATKIRSAVARASAKKRQVQTPYTRNTQSFVPRKPGVFDGMSTRQLFLGSQLGYGNQTGFNQRQPYYQPPRPSFNNFRPQYGPAINALCHYCNLPGHFAKYCPYSEQLQRRQPPAATFTGASDKQ